MKTIFANITSPIASAVTVIRISGSKTKQCLAALGFRKELIHRQVYFHKIFFDDNFDQFQPELEGNRAQKNLHITQNSQIIDEAIIVYFAAPNSFTGEDVAEISIHSSPYIVKKIFERLLRLDGVDLAEGGEFSKRAFLNGKMDLVQAEAIPDLIASETELQHRQAMNQLQGKLGEIYEKWRRKIIELCALIEALIDFPEDDLPQNIADNLHREVDILKKEIAEHLDDNNFGHKIKNGFNLAIIGAPNVGKSSLINFLSQSEAAIVSEIAGTTRDIIDVHLEILGFPVVISDTAGIRSSSDLIEQEGVRRALKKAENADLKIYVIDITDPRIDANMIDKNTILLLNKIDKVEDFLCDSLNDKNFIDSLKIFDDSVKKIIKEESLPVVPVSISGHRNLNQLIKILEQKFSGLTLPFANPKITQERYRVSCEKCLESLENFSLKAKDLNKNAEIAAEYLRICVNEISKINGKINIENILDVVFSRFCIGK